MPHLIIKIYFKISLFISFMLFLSMPLHAQDNTKMVDSINKQLDIAFYLNEEGKDTEALTLINWALTESKKINNELLIAESYNVLGISHSSVDVKQTKAIEYYNKALPILIARKDTLKIVFLYNNLGNAYGLDGNDEKAIITYMKAIDLAQKEVDKLYCYHNISEAYNRLGNYKMSEKFAHKSLKIIKSTDIDSLDLAYAYQLITETKVNKKEYDSANYYIKKSKLISKTIDKLPEVKAELLDLEYLINKNTNNHDEAYKNIDKINKFRDSIQELKKFEIYQDIEAKYKQDITEEKLTFNEEKNNRQSYLITVLIILTTLLLVGIFFIVKANISLNKAKKESERLSQAKSKFYSEISHELRTPLYNIIEITNLFKNENLNAVQTDYIESLSFSSNYLFSLINNVLEYNKMLANKIEIDESKFNPQFLIKQIINAFNYSLKEQNNTITLDIDSSIPNELVGDSLKLSQILINLISNAIKFTQNGKITISLQTLKNTENEVTIHFNISDNGIGILAKNQALIFNKFHQENGKNTHSLKGSGLGLFIVFNLVKALGSHIQLKSKVGEGSSFYFDLSFSKITQTTISKVSEPSKDILKGYSILVVDDNKINLKITKHILENYGALATIVESGKESIEKTKRNNYDCILMDINMPILDGYQTTKLIRIFNKKIPILLLTAAITEDITTVISEHQLNDFIIKPFLHPVFITKILNAINEEKTFSD